MAKYITLDGEVTTKDDPNRGVWYGPCGYWTDDWNRLARGITTGTIPSCPICHVPGFQIPYKEWISGAQKYEREGNLRYVEYLERIKQFCTRKASMLKIYELVRPMFK